MEKFSLLIPLLLAFSSLLHCLGMCGGIIGAMTFHISLDKTQKTWPFLLAANAGRLTSYTGAGALVALFGQTLFSTLSPSYGHTFLQGFAGLILIGTGLSLIGHIPATRWLERLGAPLWHRLEPMAKRFMTPKTLLQAFLFGTVWGWFPCSLVYGALLWSGTACSASSGALIMLLFGMGTLPVMLSTGWLAGDLVRFGGVAHFKKLTAWLLLGIGIFNLLLLGLPMHNARLHEITNIVNCLSPP